MNELHCDCLKNRREGCETLQNKTCRRLKGVCLKLGSLLEYIPAGIDQIKWRPKHQHLSEHGSFRLYGYYY